MHIVKMGFVNSFNRMLDWYFTLGAVGSAICGTIYSVKYGYDEYSLGFFGLSMFGFSVGGKRTLDDFLYLIGAFGKGYNHNVVSLEKENLRLRDEVNRIGEAFCNVVVSREELADRGLDQTRHNKTKSEFDGASKI